MRRVFPYFTTEVFEPSGGRAADICDKNIDLAETLKSCVDDSLHISTDRKIARHTEDGNSSLLTYRITGRLKRFFATRKV